MAYYYRQKYPFYKSLPNFRNDCISEQQSAMKFLYPSEKTTIFLPKDFEGKTNELILKVAHSNKSATLYWYLDAVFLGATYELHQMAIVPKVEIHSISVSDNFGSEIPQKSLSNSELTFWE
jgi:penicillin-binding protein 1C